MKIQSIKWIMIVLGIMLIIVGCGPKSTQSAPPPSPPATPVSFPTGVFTKANWTMEIFDDGSCHVFQQFVDDVCTYTVTGNQVVFQGDKCKGDSGIYNWSYDGQVLSFTVVEDKCAETRNVLDQSKWQKKP